MGTLCAEEEEKRFEENAVHERSKVERTAGPPQKGEVNENIAMRWCINGPLALKTLLIEANSLKVHVKITPVLLVRSKHKPFNHAPMTIFGKKKLTADKVARLFADAIVSTVEKGFPEVAGFINDSPEFVKSPGLDEEDCGRFLMVVISGNFAYMSQFFKEGQDAAIRQHSIELLAPVFDLSGPQFEVLVQEYEEFIQSVNKPSTNLLAGMSKTIFCKYDLNSFQDNFFQTTRTPNPIFIKNLNEILRNFLWDWEAFTERYRVAAELSAVQAR